MFINFEKNDIICGYPLINTRLTRRWQFSLLIESVEKFIL